MQTNRINGAATIDILNGRIPERMVGLHAGGTPNHKIEAASVAVGLHCFLRPNPSKGETAAKRAIELLENQVRGGHMLQEVFTDSHAPIWLRAMTSLRFYCLKIRQRSGLVNRLDDLVQQWFEHHFACLSLGWVPSGPLANMVILPGSRKSPDTLGNMVRDVFMQMAVTGRVQQRVGRDFFAIREDRQDTLAGPLTKKILAEGGFGPNFKRGTLPKVCGEFVAQRFDGGHVAKFPNGIPGGAKVKTSCWVEYATGKTSFEDEPVPFSGSPTRVARLAAPR